MGRADGGARQVGRMEQREGNVQGGRDEAIHRDRHQG